MKDFIPHRDSIVQNKSFQVDSPLLEAMVLTMKAPCLVLDKEFRVMFTNQSCKELVHPHSIVGKFIWDSFFIEDEKISNFSILKKLNDHKRFSLQGRMPNQTTRYALEFFPSGLYTFIRIKEDYVVNNESSLKVLTIEEYPDACITLNLQLNIIGWNKSAMKLYGWHKNEVLNKRIDQIIDTLSYDGLNQKQVIEIINQKGKWEGEVVQTNKAGKLIYCQCSFFPLTNPDGKRKGFAMINQNITPKYQIETGINQAEWRFRKITENIPQMVWTTGSDGMVDYFNKRWFEYTGLSEKESYRSQGWVEAIHPNEADTAIKKWVESLFEEIIYETEYRLKRHDGEYRWFLVRGLPLKNEEGKTIRWIGTFTDIDDQKHTEKLIENLKVENEKQSVTLSSLLISSSDSILINDSHKRIHTINKAGIEMLGFPKSKIIGKSPSQLPLPEKSKDKLNTALNHVLEKHSQYRIELTFPKGRHLEFMMNPVVQSGKVTQIISICRDITQRKSEAEKIKQSEEKFKSLVNSINDLVFIIDQNERYQDFFGLLPRKKPEWFNNFINKNALEVFGKKEGEIHQLATQKALKGEKTTYEWTFSGNSTTRFQTALSPIFNGKGQVEGIVGVCRDITAIWELEKRKNEFISLTSHELKTPVTSIKIYLQILLKIAHSAGLSKEFKDHLYKIDNQIGKLNTLISELLDVSKIQEGKISYDFSFFDLNDLVHEVAEDAESNYKTHQIEIIGSIKQPVFGDKNRISQVIENLISNAIKYSPQASKVTLWLSSYEHQCYVTVEDYGLGIDYDNQKRVFEKFFRVTKGDQQTFPGLGIGLYISNEIIKTHCGHFILESDPGKGSKFTFMLPFGTHKKTIQI
jgi:PAS domain S-box-containing protein